MDTLITYLALFGAFFAVGVPIVLSLSVAAVVMLLMNGMDLLIFAQRFIVSMDNFSLTAMFFFIFAGEIMNGGGMTKRIIAAVSKLVKGLPGGLAIIATLSCALFAAINGSAIATSIAIGSIMYPAMIKQGYPATFAAAVIAAGGVVGPIIPPSIPMIVYGATTGDSIAALFAGGIILGSMIVIGQVILIYFIAKKKGYGTGDGKNFDFGTTKGVAWALAFPVIIFVSIIGGFMTATETSALAVVYAWVVGTFIYKEFKMKDLPGMVYKAMKGSGYVMAIVGAATAVAWVLTFERVPQQVTEAMVQGINAPATFMVISFFLLLVIGMIMDLTPAILILSGIFMGPVLAFGIDPIYFGVFFCAVLTAGLITPPVGTLIYLGCSQSKAKFNDMVRALFPFVVVVYVVLFLVSLFPDIITYLPKEVFNLY